MWRRLPAYQGDRGADPGKAFTANLNSFMISWVFFHRFDFSVPPWVLRDYW
jgi:hypothetical protein